MKPIVLTTIVWVLSATICYGQVRATQAGSAEARQKIQEQIDKLREQRAELDQSVKTGRDLFGDDEQYRSSEYAGTLARKTPPDFSIGDWGRNGQPLEVLSKVSQKECLVLPKYRGSQPMLIRGLDMSKVTSGLVFSLPRPVLIQSTYDYTAVSGAKKTVLVLEFNKAKLEALAAPERERLALERERAANAKEAALTRTWTVTEQGKEQQVFQAKYLEYTNKRVYLKRTDDGKRVDFHWFHLSKLDQKWVLAQLRDGQPQSKGKGPGPRRGVAAASAESRQQEPERQRVAQAGDSVASVKEEIERIKKAMEDDEERLRNATSASERRRLENWLKTYKDRLTAQEKKLAELEKN
jgi:hypothetical protein